LFGLEIEAEYNTSLTGLIKKSSYHSVSSHSAFGTKWFVETDGSLRRTKFSDTAEFISVPLPKSEVMDALKQFKKKFQLLSKNKAVELVDVLNFNESTGAHIHISLLIHDGKQTSLSIRRKVIKLNGTNTTIKFVPVEYMKEIGKNFKKAIKKQMPDFYPAFNKRYYRTYAHKVEAKKAYTTRTTEFNYTTNYGTIEYRSPNLTGISTWKDFFKFYQILTDTISDYFVKELDKAEPFVQTFNFSTETSEDDEDLSLKVDLAEEEVVNDLMIDMAEDERLIFETLEASRLRNRSGGN